MRDDWLVRQGDPWHLPTRLTVPRIVSSAKAQPRGKDVVRKKLGLHRTTVGADQSFLVCPAFRASLLPTPQARVRPSVYVATPGPANRRRLALCVTTHPHSLTAKRCHGRRMLVRFDRCSATSACSKWLKSQSSTWGCWVSFAGPSGSGLVPALNVWQLGASE